MLTNLSFQNFKSWEDTGNIRLGKITGLFGTNSSGKTAILQLLLMLKQTVESSDRQRILHFGDEHTYVDLGTSYDVLLQHKIPGELSFSLSWNTGLFKFRSDISLNSVISIHYNSMEVLKFVYSHKGKREQGTFLGMQRQKKDSKKNAYTMIDEGINLEDRKVLFREKESFNEEEEKFFSSPVKFYGFPINVRSRFINSNFSAYVRDFEYSFERVYYLGPLREYPRRLYAWSGEKPQDVGRRGELAVAALLASRYSDEKEEGRTAEERVAFWLRELGLIYDFRLEIIAEYRREYEIRVRRNAGSAEVPITDVGFGVSQILPVLTLCYYVPKGSTILLEQPEIHLHPSVQSGLADVFIDVIKNRNVQIILESHSEHLLRRLQRRIAEEYQGMRNTDAALYFCEMLETGISQLNPLELDEYGNINNWPEDFFGDEMGDLIAMTEAAMKRQQEED